MRANSKIHSTIRHVLARSLLAGASLMAGTAVAQNAQTAQAGDQVGLAEVVVTAQFREQKLQDTPIAITAISGEAIEQHGANALADIVNTAPSVVLRPASAAFGNSITASIRGFGQADFNPAYEPGVALYIDDVYYPRLTGANFDLMDVDRVEVLRGPQGTLTGRNSEGGAIRFVSRKPTGDGGGYVEATYGIRERINLRASSDFKIAEGWTGRISGAFADQNGYVDVLDYGCSHPGSGVPAPGGGISCKQYSLGDVGYRALRGILRYNPSGALDVMLSGDYIRDVRHNGAEILLYGNNANPNVLTPNGLPLDSRFVCGQWCNYGVFSQPAAPFQAGLIPPLQGLPMAATAGGPLNTYSSYGTSLHVDAGVTDSIKVTNITAYRKWQNDFTVDTDLAPTNVGLGVNKLNSWFWSEELRVNAELTKQLSLTAGGYYSDEQTTYYSLQDIRYVAIVPVPGFYLPIFPLQFIQDDPVRTKSKAAFATAIFRPLEALTITGGLRYTKDNKDYQYFRYNLDGKTVNPFLDPIGAVYGGGYVGPDPLDANHNGNTTEIVNALHGRVASFSGSRTDYRASVDYRFAPEVMAYFTYSTGYKAGGVGPRPFNAAQARPFGPEKVTNYELGIKTDLLNRRLRINAAAFYDPFKDAQLTLLSCPQFGGPGPCALPQNGGDAKMKGVEFELFANPVAGLQLELSGSHLWWTWDCVNPQVVGLPAGPCSSSASVIGLLGPEPLGLIKEQYSAGIQYQLQLGAAGSLTPRLDATYQGPLPGSNVAAAPGSPSALYGQVGGYTIANARVTWQHNDTLVAFEVTNFLDKYYFLSKFDLTGAGSGTITGSPGRPREWAITVKKSF